MYFRRKQTLVEAIPVRDAITNVTSGSPERNPAWLQEAFAESKAVIVHMGLDIELHTATGWVTARGREQDYILRGPVDNYPCDAKTFAANYHPTPLTKDGEPLTPSTTSN